MLLLYNPDIKVQQSQREQMAVMSCLAGLLPEFETTRDQVLSSPQISSLKKVYSRVLHTEGTSSTPPIPYSGALVSRNNNHETGQSHYRSGSNGGGSNSNETRAQGSGGVVCHYYHHPGHLKHDCRKLKYETQKAHSTHIASTNDPSEKSVLITADEFAKFSQYQESLKASSTPVTFVTAIVNSGKLNTCLLSSSSKWVIDYGATSHDR